jgi:hypothetical protein
MYKMLMILGIILVILKVTVAPALHGWWVAAPFIAATAVWMIPWLVGLIGILIVFLIGD